ncbi:MAG TPA: hypothetical protein VF209_00965 [Patescibacteria group bacterium]
MKRLFLTLLTSLSLFLLGYSPAWAQEGEVLGIHILAPQELAEADTLISTSNQDAWHYVTIPFSLADLEKKDQWQAFFDQAKEKKIIPLVRLVTKPEGAAWIQPTRKNITDQITFLKQLSWPTDKKHIIVFNEVNHAKEWGGVIDPVGYTEVLRFTALWAHSEQANFVVLPAAMDLAAPNGSATMEAFTYLEKMYEVDPEIFAHVDAWNSHSYPNPAFSASPRMTTQNSLRGFEHELAYLKKKTNRDYQVYITETGWVSNRATLPWLESYYTYALQHIWSDPRVVAVTPFVLRGSPGPFAGFTFIDAQGRPTVHYQALQNAVKKTSG